MIRNSVEQNFFDLIERNTCFLKADFSFSQKAIEDGVFLIFEYFGIPQYSFRLKILRKIQIVNQKAFSYQFSPGFFFLDEEGECSSINELYPVFVDWAMRLDTDISTKSQTKRIERLEDEYKIIYERFADQTDYFTKEEAKIWQEKLDEIKETLAAHLDEESNKEDIENINRDITHLKDSVVITPKNHFIKKFGARCINWSSKSENQKLLIDSLKTVEDLMDSGN